MVNAIAEWFGTLSILEWLAGGASLVTIGGGTAAIARNVRQRRAATKGKTPRYVPRMLELVPIRFEINVGEGNTPEARIVFRAINYRSREVRVTDVRVPLLQLHGGPNLDRLISDDHYDIPPYNSREVYCRLKLHPSDADQIRTAAKRSFINQGTVMFSAHGKLNKRERWHLKKRHADVSETNRSIFGTIHGVPPHPWYASGTMPFPASDQ